MKNTFLYNTSDLEYIFIRARKPGSPNKWDNVSLKEISDVDFVVWAQAKFGVKIVDDTDQVGLAWTDEQKVDFLNEMSERIGAPAVTMIKREAREQYKVSG